MKFTKNTKGELVSHARSNGYRQRVAESIAVQKIDPMGAMSILSKLAMSATQSPRQLSRLCFEVNHAHHHQASGRGAGHQHFAAVEPSRKLGH